MVNYTGNGYFGTDKDPVSNGQVGGKTTKVETVFARKLKKIQGLNAKEYLQKASIVDSDGKKHDIYEVFLAGEDGIDIVIKGILTVYLAKLDLLMQNTEDDYEQIRLIKECLKTTCKIKEILYGKKVRAPEGLSLYEASKTAKLFEELGKDDGT